MIVVDASAVVAVIFDEATRDQVLNRLQNAPLAAPTLLPFEVANGCLKKIVRHPEVRNVWLEAFATLSDWEIEFHTVDLPKTLGLALQHRLTAYDASYLWLARELGADLVTLDQRLERAYAAMGSR